MKFFVSTNDPSFKLIQIEELDEGGVVDLLLENSRGTSRVF
jgi:hypothetical protein